MKQASRKTWAHEATARQVHVKRHVRRERRLFRGVSSPMVALASALPSRFASHPSRTFHFHSGPSAEHGFQGF